MPERNLYDEGGDDFAWMCPHCGEWIYSDVGCTNCMQIPRCEHDWKGCGPRNIFHECRLKEGHAPPHICEWCHAPAPAEEVPA
jgi:hypothetical protein